MTRLLSLSALMLRYRVAMMIWMFMLLGAAFQPGPVELSIEYLWATLALGASYVSATTINDVADEEVDVVNHPNDRGRPLVTGEANKRDLLQVNAAASVVALLATIPIGPKAVAIIAISLSISYAYSASPLRLSYRTYLAPIALSLAYVALPYMLGVELRREAFDAGELPFLFCLFLLFLARINLKDFRDRAGDSLYGKPTLLLRFGKALTCTVSLIALLAGCTLLLVALRPPGIAAAALCLFFVGILHALSTLWKAPEGFDEQVAIGMGARMGNGLLISVLAWLLALREGAAMAEGTTLVLILACLFGASYVMLLIRPSDVVIGYKG